MRNLFLCGLVAILVSSGCGPGALERARLRYQADRDYASLETIYERLKMGMERAAVERLLGQPGYSPTEGQVYYLSDRQVAMGAQHQVPIGIVVDYRDRDGAVTDELQTFWIGPIGE